MWKNRLQLPRKISSWFIGTSLRWWRRRFSIPSLFRRLRWILQRFPFCDRQVGQYLRNIQIVFIHFEHVLEDHHIYRLKERNQSHLRSLSPETMTVSYQSYTKAICIRTIRHIQRRSTESFEVHCGRSSMPLQNTHNRSLDVLCTNREEITRCLRSTVQQVC